MVSTAKSAVPKGIKWVSLQFTDINGRLREVSISAPEFNPDGIEKGFPKLDGSSIDGFAEIHESDMVLSPVTKTLRRVPWDEKSMLVINKLYKKSGEGRFEKDPRLVAERTEEELAKNGFSAFIAPEIEFFIFDKVDIDAALPQAGIGYKLYSEEAPWSNSAQAINYKKGYYPVTPMDKTAEVRRSIAEILSDSFGMQIEAVHHEVATAGQAEINFRYSTLLDTSDKVQMFKYVARNVSAAHQKIATFMPKPMFGDNGSGMHTNISLWNKSKNKNLMYDQKDKYCELSQLGRYAVGGLLEHARALSAIVSPTTNSYRRLVPGYEAPTYIAWSRSNRSIAARIPTYHKGIPSTKRIEYRPPDPSANPYLAFSAVLMAALDGVKRKIEPGDPVDENVYHMTEKRKQELKIPQLPGSLIDALSALKSDSEFLKPVFDARLLDAYIDLKQKEAERINSYPHPIELSTYFDL